MRGFLTQQAPFLRLLVVLMTSVLLFSFGLHTFQVDHTHPGTHTDANGHHESAADPSSYTEYLHGSEKKLFLLLVLGFLALGAVLKRDTILTAILLTFLVSPLKQDTVFSVRTFDIHSLLLRRGILHSKAH